MNIQLKLAIIFLFLCVVPSVAQSVALKEKPQNFQPNVEAVACFIRHEDKILLLHRQDAKPQGSLWAAPGGKIEKTESPLQAARRETFEETGLQLQKNELSFVGKYYIKNEQSSCILHVFEAHSQQKPVDIKLSIKEHKGFTWVTPEEALSMNLLPDEDILIKDVYPN